MSEEIKVKRKDIFLVPITEIEEIKGSIEHNGMTFSENARQDYGDLNLLAKQIEENGIRVPCKGFKHKSGKYYLTDGHRRYRASMKVMQKTGEVIMVPMIMHSQTDNEETRLIDMIICNEGKSLNPVEQAEVVQRLIEMEIGDAEIKKRTGFSSTYLSNLRMLSKSPEKIKDYIKENIISSTLAMKVMREEKDFDKAVSVIENAIASTDFNDSDKKSITDKDIDRSKGKLNSFSALRKALKKGAKLKVKPDKQKLFSLLTGINEGRYTFEWFMETLFEEPSDDDSTEVRTGKQHKDVESELSN